MKEEFKTLSDIEVMITRVNSNVTGVFLRVPEPITRLRPEISGTIGDTHIHISEFIIAKIQGKIKGLNSHPEITDDIFIRLPDSLNNPVKILIDSRSVKKYIFIASSPKHVIVVETRRKESGVTEINTLYRIDRNEQRRLDKFPTAYCQPSGGTPSFPSCMPRP